MGILAGLVAGMVGLGGGLILVPFMILFGVPPNVAAATANCFMVSTSCSGFTAYWAQGWVDKKTGLLLMGGSFFGGVAGVSWVGILLASGRADAVIRACFAVITGVIGLTMLRDVLRGERRSGPAKEAGKNLGRGAVFLCGLAAGLSSSVLGIAGGVFIVPFLIYSMAFEARTAVGTGLMQILFTTTLVSLLHAFQNQNLDIVLAVYLMAGAGAGARMGVLFSRRSSARMIKGVFAVVALAGAVRLGMDSFFHTTVSRVPTVEGGIGAALGDLLRTHSLAYGMASVGLALGIGFFWGRLFQKG